MALKRIFIGLTVIFILLSCEKKESGTVNIVMDDGSLEASQRKIEDKRAKGDTLAMSHDTLTKFLPKTIEGFAQENEGTGQTINEDGMSWSAVERKYKKGNQNVIITLSDYNGAYGLYAGATILLEDAEGLDNEAERVELLSQKGGKVRTRTSYKKDVKEANLLAGFNDRFVITISADNQKDTELVKKVLEGLELDTLLKL